MMGNQYRARLLSTGAGHKSLVTLVPRPGLDRFASRGLTLHTLETESDARAPRGFLAMPGESIGGFLQSMVNMARHDAQTQRCCHRRSSMQEHR